MTASWLTVWICLLHSVSISLCTRIIANTTNEHLNQLISCDDEATCSIECVSYRSCMASTIQCNNSSACLIHCDGLESCSFSSIYQSSSNHVEITCKNKQSCLFMNIYQQPELSSTPRNTANSTFTLHAIAPSAAQHLNIHDAISHTSYNLYCNESLSCNSLFIHFDPNTSITDPPSFHSNTDYDMNIMCNGPESCKAIRIETTDHWYNLISDHNLVYTALDVRLYCNNWLSCEDATFDFSRLLANGFGNERKASDFGNIHLYCTDQDSSCDYLRLTCPDLVPFDAYYDHLYQQENIKCHIAMTSYSELVTVVSKHGFNMVDIACDDTNSEICDEVVLFCSEVDIKCAMNYDSDNATWICDDLGEYYTFPANEDAVYGCNAFVWFSDTAIIKTSQIPDYSIDAHSYLWCLSYNPAMTQQCIINCDSEYSCFEATLDCADSTQCIINCDAKEACGASFESPDWTTIHCPYNWPVGSVAISPVRSCDIIAHPELDAQTYGSFFSELWITTYDNNVVSLDHDPTLSWFLFDYGMTSLAVNIADYPQVDNFSVYDDYFVDNWYRIHNQLANTDPVTITMSCVFCYNVWILFNGYWSKVGSKSYISCYGNCMNSQIDIYGVTENYVYCAYTASSNCDRTDISIVDGFLYTECYINCDALSIYNNPYLHYDYTALYNVMLHSYEYPLADTINIYSLYGFDTLSVTYANYPGLNALDLIQGHCGYPNYYKDCGSYPFLNASCNFTQCSATHPKYETIALATVPFQYFKTTITSLFTMCRAYEACWNIDIQCGVPVDAGRDSSNNGKSPTTTNAGDCLVICHERFACFNSTIYANEYALTVECAGYRSCEMVTVYGSTSAQDIEINCLNALACRDMFVDDSMATDIEDGNSGLRVTCFDLNAVLEIVSYRSTSCMDVRIQCPSTPTSKQLVNTNTNTYDSLDAKCYLRLEKNVIPPINIEVRNEANGVAFFDIECEYNNQTQVSSCADVTYFCDANDTMSSAWYYDIDTSQHVCNGSCCDFINSESPTSSPTSAPTRAPTVWRYEMFFEALYGLVLTFESMDDLEGFETEMHNHSLAESLEEDIYFMEDMQDALQVAYFKSDALPSFADFHVNVTNITYDATVDVVPAEDSTDLNDTSAVSRDFHMYARVSSVNITTIDRFLAITRYSFDFEPNFIDYLQSQYEKYPTLRINFSVIDVFYTAPVQEEPEEGFEVSQGTFISIGVTGTLFIVALCSFLYSKKLWCFKNTPDADDTQYLDVMSYGMQTFDLYTDITFSLELYTKYRDIDIDDPKYAFIEFLWIFSLVFIGLPYICNLVMAVTFQSDSRFGANLTLNLYTETWFRSYNTVFCLFVMLSGSVFASLQLVNCKVFGLFLFHAGISAIEIESVDKLKIYYITLLENVPQLMIQIFYVVNFGQEAITVTFVASTVSSIFNITLTVMSFLARQTSKAKINIQTMASLEIEVVLKDEELERMDHDGANGADIIPKEVRVLHRRQGRRRALTKNVTVTLNRLDGNFEFLYSVPNARGIKLFGICVSDTPTVLSAQVEKFEKKLISVVKSTFGLENAHRWEVTLRVPMEDGTDTPLKEVPNESKEVERPEGADTETERTTVAVPTTHQTAVLSDSENVISDVEMQTQSMQPTQPTHVEMQSADVELMDVLSENDIEDIQMLLKDLND